MTKTPSNVTSLFGEAKMGARECFAAAERIRERRAVTSLDDRRDPVAVLLAECDEVLTRLAAQVRAQESNVTPLFDAFTMSLAESYAAAARLDPKPHVVDESKVVSLDDWRARRDPVEDVCRSAIARAEHLESLGGRPAG